MSVCPEDFRSDIAPDRVEGTEGEMMVWNTTANGGFTPVYDYIDGRAAKAAGYRRIGQFLNYGCKLHEDADRTIELATREGLGSVEAAAEDHHGIEIVQSVVTASGRPHRGVYRTAGTFLEQYDEKGSRIDPAYDPEFGKTSGFHHNFLIPRGITTGQDLDLLVHVLGAHLSSRIWAWGGALRPEGFVFSQKVWGLGAPIAIGYGDRTKQGNKQMAAVLPRDTDTTGDGFLWARFEDRSPDPSFSIEVTELTLATTSLALRLVEHADKLGTDKQSGRDRLLSRLALKNPVQAAKDFAGDLTMTDTAETLNGEHLTALDIQERLAEFAIELTELDGFMLPGDEQHAAYDWLERVQLLRKCSPAEGSYSADILAGTNFAPRHATLLKQVEPHELNVLNQYAAMLNLRWDRILPPTDSKDQSEGLGLRYWRGLYRRQNRAWPGKPKSPHTRGALREELLSRPDATFANWVKIIAGENEYWLMDPYQTEFEQAA